MGVCTNRLLTKPRTAAFYAQGRLSAQIQLGFPMPLSSMDRIREAGYVAQIWLSRRAGVGCEPFEIQHPANEMRLFADAGEPPTAKASQPMPFLPLPKSSSINLRPP